MEHKVLMVLISAIKGRYSLPDPYYARARVRIEKDPILDLPSPAGTQAPRESTAGRGAK